MGRIEHWRLLTFPSSYGLYIISLSGVVAKYMQAFGGGPSYRLLTNIETMLEPFSLMLGPLSLTLEPFLSHVRIPFSRWRC